MTSRLSEREKMFAEEHYDVLEGFLDKRSIPKDECYDAVVFKFLNAVKQYHENESLRQHEFAAVADTLMQNALSSYLRKREHDRREYSHPLSLDYRLSDSALTFGDIVADNRINICDEVCEKLSPTIHNDRLLHIHPDRRIRCTIELMEVM